MTIEDGVFQLEPPFKACGIRLPVDRFLRSLASDQREQAVAIILSGTGSDGTLGIQAIKEAGGLVMVQDPDTARHDGMPRSALKSGMVDLTLPISEMPKALKEYSEHLYTRPDRQNRDQSDGPEDDLAKVLELVQGSTNHDFSGYKQGTIRRRVHRRMGLGQIKNLKQYHDMLRQNPREIDHLFSDLLISVTAFFRDNDIWEALQPVVAAQPERRPIRSPSSSMNRWRFRTYRSISMSSQRTSTPGHCKRAGQDPIPGTSWPM